MSSVLLVARTYLSPIASTRALRLGTLIGFLLIVAAWVLKAIKLLDADSLASLRSAALVPALPLYGALIAEMALRDGIRSRTLLYPMLGPVSRRTLAIVRTTLTGLVLAIGALLLVAALHLIEGSGWRDFPRELLAALLGGLAYAALFGCLHLVNTRGLVTALGLFLILDDPLGRLPFGIRNLSPAHHLRVLVGEESTFDLPIDISSGDASIAVSALVLASVAIAATLGVAAIFERKSLGELS